MTNVAHMYVVLHTTSNRSVDNIHYRITSDRFQQMPEHDVSLEKKEKATKKHWRANIQLPAKFQKHRKAFWERIRESESI